MTATLTSFLSKETLYAPDTKEFKELFVASLRFLTRSIEAYEFQKIVSPYISDINLSAKGLKDRLLESKYFTFNIKCFTYRVIRLKPKENSASVSVVYKVRFQDHLTITRLLKSMPSLRRELKAIVSKLPNYIPSPSDADYFFEQSVYMDVMRYIKKVVYFKCTFLGNLEESQSDVLFKVVQTFYRQYPSEMTDSHIVGYLKRTAKNHALNIIEKATRKKRGFGIAVSENQTSNDGEDQYSLQNKVEFSIDPTDTTLNEIFVADVLNKYKKKDKKYRLLLILMGDFDQGFTDWLHENRHCKKSEDNVGLQERLDVDSFRTLLSSFLRWKDTKVAQFLVHLRTQTLEKGKANVKKKRIWHTICNFSCANDRAAA